MSDRQRQRVYAAENAVMPALDGGRLFPGIIGARTGTPAYRKIRAERLAAAKRITDLVTTTDWWYEVTGLSPRQVGVKLAPISGRRSYGGQFASMGWGISLTMVTGIRPWVVAHELAHVATYRAGTRGFFGPTRKHHTQLEGHGPEYAATYVAIVRLLLGADTADALLAAFAAGRVVVDDRTGIANVPGLPPVPDTGPHGIFGPRGAETNNVVQLRRPTPAPVARAASAPAPIKKAEQLGLFD